MLRNLTLGARLSMVFRLARVQHDLAENQTFRMSHKGGFADIPTASSRHALARNHLAPDPHVG